MRNKAPLSSWYLLIGLVSLLLGHHGALAWTAHVRTRTRVNRPQLVSMAASSRPLELWLDVREKDGAVFLQHEAQVDRFIAGAQSGDATR